MKSRKSAPAAALCAALVLFTGNAYAASYPDGSQQDRRIKTVEYSPTNTVVINAVAGLAVHIVLAPGEKYITHVFGDPKAWAFAHVGNSYFIKPTSDEFADTNLVIVTDRHTYNILLRAISSYTTKGSDGAPVRHLIHVPWTMKVATVQVTYQYPETKAKLTTEALEKQQIAASLKAWKYAGPVNLNYVMSNDKGSKAIQPLNVWDNYRFTFFRFAPNATLPALFAVGPDSKEGIANVSIEGENHNIIVAHSVAGQWRIRYGKQVVGVVNKGYKPSEGANPSGTDSPDVRRVLDVNEGANP